MKAPTLARRYPLRSLSAGARWLLNPVSEGGTKQVPREAPSGSDLGNSLTPVAAAVRG